MPQRYFVNQINGIIEAQDAHHITRVMRMKPQDEVIVCSEGNCVLASLETLGERVTYTIKQAIQSRKHMHITLIQGLPKHPKQEFVTKYATLFGASSIIFVQMQRSISKLENTEHKINRLISIAKEAAELGHQSSVPTISMALQMDKIDFEPYDLILLADELETEKTIPQIAQQIHLNSRVAIIIGPEGGIAEAERKALMKRKVIPISLGSHILPTEAASLYALALLSNQNA
jgi:16S rRNA (uracil1498-N3)-methyltransferase